MNTAETESIKYDQPKIVDYGSLVELTKMQNQTNTDVVGGSDGTADIPGSPS